MKTRCPICQNEYEDVYKHATERRMHGGHALGSIEAGRMGIKKPEPVASGGSAPNPDFGDWFYGLS